MRKESGAYFYLPLSTEIDHQADANMDAFLRFVNEGVG